MPEMNEEDEQCQTNSTTCTFSNKRSMPVSGNLKLWGAGRKI